MALVDRYSGLASRLGMLGILLQCSTITTSSFAARTYIFLPQQSYSLVSSRILVEGGDTYPLDCDEFDNCLPRPDVELINSSSSTELVTSISSNTDYGHANPQKASINLSMLPSSIRIDSQNEVDGIWAMHYYSSGFADASWKGDFEVIKSGKYEINLFGMVQGDFYQSPLTVSANLSMLGVSAWSGNLSPGFFYRDPMWTETIKQVLDLDPGMYQLSFASHASAFISGPYKVYSGLTLNPIPEPATWGLLTLGLAALLLQQRTHRKAQPKTPLHGRSQRRIQVPSPCAAEGSRTRLLA